MSLHHRFHKLITTALATIGSFTGSIATVGGPATLPFDGLEQSKQWTSRLEPTTTIESLDDCWATEVAPSIAAQVDCAISLGLEAKTLGNYSGVVTSTTGPARLRVLVESAEADSDYDYVLSGYSEPLAGATDADMRPVFKLWLSPTLGPERGRLQIYPERWEDLGDFAIVPKERMQLTWDALESTSAADVTFKNSSLEVWHQLQSDSSTELSSDHTSRVARLKWVVSEPHGSDGHLLAGTVAHVSGVRWITGAYAYRFAASRSTAISAGTSAVASGLGQSFGSNTAQCIENTTASTSSAGTLLSEDGGGDVAALSPSCREVLTHRAALEALPSEPLTPPENTSADLNLAENASWTLE